MKACLVLFDSIVNSRWFKDSRTHILFTKLDLLPDLLSQDPIQEWWPDYIGDPQSETDLVEFFAERFRSCNRNEKKEIAVKAINLIDTQKVHQWLEDEILKPRSKLEPS